MFHANECFYDKAEHFRFFGIPEDELDKCKWAWFDWVGPKKITEIGFIDSERKSLDNEEQNLEIDESQKRTKQFLILFQRYT